MKNPGTGLRRNDVLAEIQASGVGALAYRTWSSGAKPLAEDMGCRLQHAYATHAERVTRFELPWLHLQDIDEDINDVPLDGSRAPYTGNRMVRVRAKTAGAPGEALTYEQVIGAEAAVNVIDSARIITTLAGSYDSRTTSAAQKARLLVSGLRIVAVTAGVAGNSIEFAAMPTEADQVLAIDVTDLVITVTPATDAQGIITSTIQEVIDALNNSGPASALIVASFDTDGQYTSADDLFEVFDNSLDDGLDAISADAGLLLTAKLSGALLRCLIAFEQDHSTITFSADWADDYGGHVRPIIAPVCNETEITSTAAEILAAYNALDDTERFKLSVNMALAAGGDGSGVDTRTESHWIEGGEVETTVADLVALAAANPAVDALVDLEPFLGVNGDASGTPFTFPRHPLQRDWTSMRGEWEGLIDGMRSYVGAQAVRLLLCENVPGNDEPGDDGQAISGRLEAIRGVTVPTEDHIIQPND